MAVGSAATAGVVQLTSGCGADAAVTATIGVDELDLLDLCWRQILASLLFSPRSCLDWEPSRRAFRSTSRFLRSVAIDSHLTN
jgi:hypothetical protein